jgi:hypothetical protein
MKIFPSIMRKKTLINPQNIGLNFIKLRIWVLISKQGKRPKIRDIIIFV